MNSTSHISSFNANVLTYSANNSITLNNGNEFYFDMYHDANAKPDSFQVDAPSSEEEQTPDDKAVIESPTEESTSETDEDNAVKDPLTQGNKSRYVVSRNKNKVYTLFRRIDSVDIGQMPVIKDKDGNVTFDANLNTYYKRVASTKRSRYYTFNTPDLVFELERAFSPQFPAQAVSLQHLSSNEPFTMIVYKEPSYKKGQNIIGYSNMNPERIDGVTLFVKDVYKNLSTGNFEATFEISNNSLPLFR